jgi:hypothetical protein
MKPWEALKNYEARGCRFSIAEDGTLAVEVHGCILEPRHREFLKEHRDALLECLRDRQRLAETLAEDIERADSHDQLELALEKTNAGLLAGNLTGRQVEHLARQMVSRARRLHRPPTVTYVPSVTA